MREPLRQIPWRWLMAGALIGLAAGLIAFYGLPSSSTRSSERQQGLSQQLGTLEVGSEAPEFSLQSVAGESVELSSYRGQVVFLNFWATWCGPCRVEMPTLQTYYDRYRDEGFTVFGVNAGEDQAQVEAFQQELGITFPLLLDPDERIQRRYRVRAYPTSILIDRQGKIAKVHFGILTEEQLGEYLAELEVGS
ncbi:MAG: redoxin domain-containing protein [Anaerolineales bacterium]|nr:redoxin domain-containing protein [Anaerolineales bacterium]